jgi:hypothetical protein
MPLFGAAVRYLDKSVAAPASSSNTGCSSWSWGTPDYVQPEGSSSGGGDGGSPQGKLTADIASPAFTADGAVLMKGAGLVFLVPSGAKKFRVWFAPPKPAAPGAALAAVPVATDGLDAGTVDAAQMTVTPIWHRLAPEAIEAGTVNTTVLVTFE